ncbi:hypothetical protein LINGRAHAP2_LOCUS20240 [Linum grandiflorum]
MAHRLWGFEGDISVSTLSDGFFLLEFPSQRLFDWVLARDWHIHHSMLVLRRWEKGIQPLAFSPQVKPVWVTIHSVPPQLLFPEGISWVVSQVGIPINNFFRTWLNVKICVLLKGVSCPEHIELIVKDGDRVKLLVSCSGSRSYTKAPQWRRKPLAPNASKAAKANETVAPEVVDVIPPPLAMGATSAVRNVGTDEFSVDPIHDNPFGLLSEVIARLLVSPGDRVDSHADVVEDILVVDTTITTARLYEIGDGSVVHESSLESVGTPLRLYGSSEEESASPKKPTKATLGDFLSHGKSAPAKPGAGKGRGRGREGGQQPKQRRR